MAVTFSHLVNSGAMAYWQYCLMIDIVKLCLNIMNLPF